MVEAYDIILHKGVDGQTYNIGSQVERTVLSVAHDVLSMMRLPADMIMHVRDRAFNDRRYFVCDKKLAKLGAELFNWRPQELERLQSLPASISLSQHVHDSSWRRLALTCCGQSRRITSALHRVFWQMYRCATELQHGVVDAWFKDGAALQGGMRRRHGRRAWPRRWSGTESMGSAATGMTMQWRSPWMPTPPTLPARMHSARPPWASRTTTLDSIDPSAGAVKVPL